MNKEMLQMAREVGRMEVEREYEQERITEIHQACVGVRDIIEDTLKIVTTPGVSRDQILSRLNDALVLLEEDAGFPIGDTE